MEFAAGTRVGKYELGRKLGEGGFGAVFVARDTGLDRDVALKFLRSEHTRNPQILQRFLQEARSAARIAHPGIVTVFECAQVADTGTELDGTAFIAMELLVGESLANRIARTRRLDAGTAVDIARQVASALDAAHDVGIVHRDLKPDNIFLVRDPLLPGGERVKVLDFGIAKLQAQATGTGSGVQTASVMVFGTPRYMAPEQCKSAALADHRSDVYALGCVLFELVTGRPPFEGEPGELIAKHQYEPAPSARSLTPDIPPQIDGLIAKLLAKAPDARPQSMAKVQDAIATCGIATMASGSAPTLAAVAGRAPGVALATTLSSASGVASAPAPRRMRAGWVVAGVATALGVAVTIAIATGNTTGNDVADRPAVTPEPAAQHVGATPAPSPPPPAQPVAAGSAVVEPPQPVVPLPPATQQTNAKVEVGRRAAAARAEVGPPAAVAKTPTKAVETTTPEPARPAVTAPATNTAAGSATPRPPPCAPVKDGMVDPFHPCPH